VKLTYKLSENQVGEPEISIVFQTKTLGNEPGDTPINMEMLISDMLIASPAIGGFLSCIIDGCRTYAKDNGITIYIKELEDNEK